MTEELKEPTPIVETVDRPLVIKKKKGWPKGKKRTPRKVVKPAQEKAPTQDPGQSVVNIDLSRDQVLAETILETPGYTDEDVDNIVFGVENQGNAYDWVRNMDEFRLPKPLQELADKGIQAFRWIDSSDNTCMMQVYRDNFRWTPVNMLTHGKYFKGAERKARFNKHGGIMSGYMLLCWMPGKLYKAWCEVKRRMSSHESPMDKPSKTPGVLNYDPVAEGTAAANIDAGDNKPLYATEKRFSGVVHEAEDVHPDTTYDEQGEYT